MAIHANHKRLIHADPGARSGLVGAWLANILTGKSFDVGAQDGEAFQKIHHLHMYDKNIIANFDGVKIRVRPTYRRIDLHCLLFLRKNVYEQNPTFTKDEYSLETFTKLWEFAKQCFAEDRLLDYNVYDYVLNFEDTFNTEKLINLYEKVYQKSPTKAQIDALVSTNQLSNMHVDSNHSCAILKLCLDKEKELSLEESKRFWSIVDVYNTTPVNKLYNTVLEKIKPENYGTLLNA